MRNYKGISGGDCINRNITLPVQQEFKIPPGNRHAYMRWMDNQHKLLENSGLFVQLTNLYTHYKINHIKWTSTVANTPYDPVLLHSTVVRDWNYTNYKQTHITFKELTNINSNSLDANDRYIRDMLDQSGRIFTTKHIKERHTFHTQQLSAKDCREKRTWVPRRATRETQLNSFNPAYIMDLETANAYSVELQVYVHTEITFNISFKGLSPLGDLQAALVKPSLLKNDPPRLVTIQDKCLSFWNNALFWGNSAQGGATMHTTLGSVKYASIYLLWEQIGQFQITPKAPSYGRTDFMFNMMYDVSLKPCQMRTGIPSGTIEQASVGMMMTDAYTDLSYCWAIYESCMVIRKPSWSSATCIKGKFWHTYKRNPSTNTLFPLHAYVRARDLIRSETDTYDESFTITVLVRRIYPTSGTNDWLSVCCNDIFKVQEQIIDGDLSDLSSAEYQNLFGYARADDE